MPAAFGRPASFGVSAAIHLLIGLSLTSLSPADFASFFSSSAAAGSSAPPPHQTLTTFIVTPEDTTFHGLNPVVRDPDEWKLELDDQTSTLSLGSFKFDVAKVLARADVLFPFVTPGLALEHFALKPPGEMHESLDDPFAASNGRRGRRGTTRLELTDDALQKIVDQSWSRRDRWSLFAPLIALADAHDPNDGQLPDLLHAYVEQNWLQPYVDASLNLRDTRLWTEIELAADHVNFIGFIRRYTSEHPSTKAATELLFLLDKIVQASRDTLTTLLDTQPETQLRWTRDLNPPAYTLMVDLRRYYRDYLQHKGLTSLDAVRAFYDSVRLSILSGIVRTSPNGYRASDARFLIGSIYWKAYQHDAAVRAWREMTIDRTDSYLVSYSAILIALRTAVPSGANGALPAATRRTIDGVLDGERSRWLSSSYDRLHQFGYRFDTF